MTKPKVGSNDSSVSALNKNPGDTDDSDNEQKINQCSKNISKLSYEDSLRELDMILNNMQNESLLVEDLQLSYMKAKIYLKHCQELLDTLEQEVIKFNIKD